MPITKTCDLKIIQNAGFNMFMICYKTIMPVFEKDIK